MFVPLVIAFILLVAVIKQVKIHPIHFAMLAGSFFAFHLLFAYLVDRLDTDVRPLGRMPRRSTRRARANTVGASAYPCSRTWWLAVLLVLTLEAVASWVAARRTTWRSSGGPTS